MDLRDECCTAAKICLLDTLKYFKFVEQSHELQQQKGLILNVVGRLLFPVRVVIYLLVIIYLDIGVRIN